MLVSGQPFVNKHSYLEWGCLGGSIIPQVMNPEFMFQIGVIGQTLGHNT